MHSQFGFPMAGDTKTPPKYAARAAYQANLADLTAATTTCDTSVTLVEGDIVLLMAQTDHSEDGLYKVGAVASGVAPLTRADFADLSVAMPSGSEVFVSEGTASGGVLYRLTTANPIVLGTTSLTFSPEDSTHVGAHTLVHTTTGNTNVTYPTTGTLATLAGAETLTNKTLTTPTIADFTNAAHDHGDANDGGVIVESGVAPSATAYQVLRTNAGATASEWGAPMAFIPSTNLPAHVANDIIPPAIVSGAVYSIPALDAGSTITLPAAATSGTYCWIVGDGTTNDQAVTVRDATGPTNLTTALTASKRLCIFCVKVGAAWYANAYVSP